MVQHIWTKLDIKDLWSLRPHYPSGPKPMRPQYLSGPNLSGPRSIRPHITKHKICTSIYQPCPVRPHYCCTRRIRSPFYIPIVNGAGSTGAASSSWAGSTGAASTWGRIGLGASGVWGRIDLLPHEASAHLLYRVLIVSKTISRQICPS